MAGHIVKKGAIIHRWFYYKRALVIVISALFDLEFRRNGLWLIVNPDPMPVFHSELNRNQREAKEKVL